MKENFGSIQRIPLKEKNIYKARKVDKFNQVEQEDDVLRWKIDELKKKKVEASTLFARWQINREETDRVEKEKKEFLSKWMVDYTNLKDEIGFRRAGDFAHYYKENNLDNELYDAYIQKKEELKDKKTKTRELGDGLKNLFNGDIKEIDWLKINSRKGGELILNQEILIENWEKKVDDDIQMLYEQTAEGKQLVRRQVMDRFKDIMLEKSGLNDVLAVNELIKPSEKILDKNLILFMSNDFRFSAVDFQAADKFGDEFVIKASMNAMLEVFDEAQVTTNMDLLFCRRKRDEFRSKMEKVIRYFWYAEKINYFKQKSEFRDFVEQEKKRLEWKNRLDAINGKINEFSLKMAGNIIEDKRIVLSGIDGGKKIRIIDHEVVSNLSCDLAKNEAGRVLFQQYLDIVKKRLVDYFQKNNLNISVDLENAAKYIRNKIGCLNNFINERTNNKVSIWAKTKDIFSADILSPDFLPNIFSNEPIDQEVISAEDELKTLKEINEYLNEYTRLMEMENAGNSDYNQLIDSLIEMKKIRENNPNVANKKEFIKGTMADYLQKKVAKKVYHEKGSCSLTLGNPCCLRDVIGFLCLERDLELQSISEYNKETIELISDFDCLKQKCQELIIQLKEMSYRKSE